eukprot:scaffold72553_cov51-Phaeocystis_antarctica.AAC.1
MPRPRATPRARPRGNGSASRRSRLDCDLSVAGRRSPAAACLPRRSHGSARPHARPARRNQRPRSRPHRRRRPVRRGFRSPADCTPGKAAQSRPEATRCPPAASAGRGCAARREHRQTPKRAPCCHPARSASSRPPSPSTLAAPHAAAPGC